MQLRRQRWIWFAAAVAVPCSALLYLGLRLLNQEEQIARQRTREDRQHTIDNLLRDLQSALEPIRLAPAPPAEVAFHGTIRDGHAYVVCPPPPGPGEGRDRGQESQRPP